MNSSTLFDGLPSSQDANHLTISEMETLLWDAACAIRGATDAPKYKDFILPLIFFKRLSDVFDDEVDEQAQEFPSRDFALRMIKADHADSLRDNHAAMVHFYIPEGRDWNSVRNHAEDGLGEFITETLREIADQNPALKGVIDTKDFNERQSGQRTIDDDRLAALVEKLSRHRLGLSDASPDILGHAYEYLLRKFAEGQGQSAGEFYTPKEVAQLMAEVLQPRPYSQVYDPTCGSGGLLIKMREVYDIRNPEKVTQAPKLYGQELNATTFAMAKMNMFLHNYEAQFMIGDTFKNPGFASSAGITRFDYVVANPMWNQNGYPADFYENDPFKRFAYGLPPNTNADWGWAQHILRSLKEDGRAAVVLDTGAVSRGSGSSSNNKERAIRAKFVEDDVIEGVILLPENLFYNTTAPGIILVLSRAKPTDRKGEILLVNASLLFEKRKPKNYLTCESISTIAEVFREWQTREKLSRVVTTEVVREADYNLSPSQFVTVSEGTTHRPLPEILTDIMATGAEREESDKRLSHLLLSLYNREVYGH